MLLGIVVFDPRFPTAPLHLAAILGSLLVVIAAVFMVTAGDTYLSETLGTARHQTAVTSPGRGCSVRAGSGLQDRSASP